MGRAKAWLPWRGRPVLVHVVDVLREVVEDVVVVAAADQELPPLEARVVRDSEAELGPLVGIRDGLAACRGDLAFVTATDAPHITPRFVRAMLAFGKAAAPELGGFVQTLSAVYPTAAHERAGELLASGRRRPLDLLEAVGFLEVGGDELPDPRSVEGFNTPEAYLAAVRAEAPGAKAVLELLGRARVAVGRAALDVPVGTLAELLACVADRVGLVDGESVARPFSVSLDGREFLRDTRAPVGPGEHAIVLDASVGG